VEHESVQAFALVAEDKLEGAQPKLVFVDDANRMKARPPFTGHTEETVEKARVLATAN